MFSIRSFKRKIRWFKNWTGAAPITNEELEDLSSAIKFEQNKQVAPPITREQLQKLIQNEHPTKTQV